MSIKTIYFFRHGQTNYNVSKHQETLDACKKFFAQYVGDRATMTREDYAKVPLNDTGKQQAMLLAQYLQDKHLEVVVSSPYQRTLETAQAVVELAKVPLLLDERLVEVHKGEAQNLFPCEMEQKYNAETLSQWRSTDPKDADFAFPQGESKNQVIQRLTTAVINVVTAPEDYHTIGISTHASILRYFILYITKTLMETLKNSEVAVCTFDPRQYDPARPLEAFHYQGRHLVSDVLSKKNT